MSAKFVRVKRKDNGHEYSTTRPNLKAVDIVDKPAVDSYGRPLPAKTKVTVGTDPVAVTIPDGEPTETWTVAQLDAYADSQDPAIDGYADAKNKPDKLPLVVAHYQAADGRNDA